jgi:hypothetical protein
MASFILRPLGDGGIGKYLGIPWADSRQAHLDDSAVCDFHSHREPRLSLRHRLRGAPRATKPSNQLDG